MFLVQASFASRVPRREYLIDDGFKESLCHLPQLKSEDRSAKTHA